MGGDGRGDIAWDVDELVALHARRRAERDEFDASQLAALDSLARAQKHDGIPTEDADEIESLIRAGRVHGARKRLTQARRNAQTTAPE